MSFVLIKEKITCVLMGVGMVLAILFLTGAVRVNPAGQYEMKVVVRDKITQIYIMDTATGAVKWVDKMNTPFVEIKGD